MSKINLEKGKPANKVIPSSKIEMVFSKQNYVLAAASFGVVILGFLLMWGGKEDIYSFRRITLAPMVVIAGFLLGVFAIMFKPKK